MPQYKESHYVWYIYYLATTKQVWILLTAYICLLNKTFFTGVLNKNTAWPICNSSIKNVSFVMFECNWSKRPLFRIYCAVAYYVHAPKYPAYNFHPGHFILQIVRQILFFHSKKRCVRHDFMAMERFEFQTAQMIRKKISECVKSVCREKIRITI